MASTTRSTATEPAPPDPLSHEGRGGADPSSPLRSLEDPGTHGEDARDRVVGGAVRAASVTFLPDGVTRPAAPGESVLDIARRAGMYVETDCGGEGTCGKCALRVFGARPPATAADERHLTHDQLADGWRLSCRLIPAAAETPLVVQLVHQLQSVKSGADLMAAPLALKPRVRRIAVRLPEPTLEDQRSDAARLMAALAEKRFHARPTPAVLRALPAAVRDESGLVTATLAGGQIVGVEAGDASRRCYGIAFDIGTTTVVGSLLNLGSATELATAAMLNPQVTYGADVISRINRSLTDIEGLPRLHEAALHAVGTIAARLAADAGVDPRDIWELTFVGNTSMLHLLLGLDPRHLAPAPYIPAITDAVSLTLGELAVDWAAAGVLGAAANPTPPAANGKAPEQGQVRGSNQSPASGDSQSGTPPGTAVLPGSPQPPGTGTNGRHAALRPETLCYVLPGVASFVGADAVAVALATAIGESDELALAIDIGTNGEILLGSRRRLLACSAAAGPAFEGAHIRFGMRGTPGAIERVRLRDGEVQIEVIGGGAPRGICGSGLVDAVAELRRAGLIDEAGRLLAAEDARLAAGPALGSRVIAGAAGPEFVLTEGSGGPAITLAQRDIRELQLAKGALRAGVEVLLAALGARASDLRRIYLAGAFGTYVSAAAAREIGLIPPLPLARVEGVGNAAGRGSRMALASLDCRRQAENLARRIEYVELSAHLGFTDAFMDAMGFPDLEDLAAIDAEMAT